MDEQTRKIVDQVLGPQVEEDACTECKVLTESGFLSDDGVCWDCEEPESCPHCGYAGDWFTDTDSGNRECPSCRREFKNGN